MACIEKSGIKAVDSVEAVVKSIEDLALVIKGGAAWGILLPDFIKDVQAVPHLLEDIQASPWEAANSIALGAISIAKILLS